MQELINTAWRQYLTPNLIFQFFLNIEPSRDLIPWGKPYENLIFIAHKSYTGFIELFRKYIPFSKKIDFSKGKLSDISKAVGAFTTKTVFSETNFL